MPCDKQELAANLRGLRARLRLSQEQVAEAVGVSPQTIVNYENGKGGMSYETAWALADLYGVPLDALGNRQAA